MNKPMTVDLPHNLGIEEARRRIESGMDKLADHIPGGGRADVQSQWQGNRMQLSVKAMGQEVSAKIDVMETIVRLELMLPPMLSFFASRIQGYVKTVGGQLLEDKSKPRP